MIIGGSSVHVSGDLCLASSFLKRHRGSSKTSWQLCFLAALCLLLETGSVSGEQHGRTRSQWLASPSLHPPGKNSLN